MSQSRLPMQRHILTKLTKTRLRTLDGFLSNFNVLINQTTPSIIIYYKVSNTFFSQTMGCLIMCSVHFVSFNLLIAIKFGHISVQRI